VIPDAIDPRLTAEVAEQPYPLLFMTISGAHMYGFPSPDSDYDLRGAHLLPLAEVVGLHTGRETITRTHMRDGVEIDLVSHDIKNYMGLLLKKSGDTLEQLFSPLVVYTTPEHEELKAIIRRTITRNHVYHYYGMAENQWKLFNKPDGPAQVEPRRIKPLLYVFRVLLTGIHLMQTGEVEANLERLNETFRLPYLSMLIARKREGDENCALAELDLILYQREFERLRGVLEEAQKASTLPEGPPQEAKDALHDLLVRMRLHSLKARKAVAKAASLSRRQK
jgi:uncharacterized protein